MVAIGQTRSRKLIARLAALGFAEMVQPDEGRPRRRPFIRDNAAFKNWRAGREFDAEGFRAALAADENDPPLFVVVPDRVAGGVESLRFSLSWVDECRVVAPAYLVVQDGMHLRQVARVLHRFDGVFVGGTLGWKLKTAEAWVNLAHAHGKPCHIGRVGTPKRVRWAQRIGADSIDSSLPLWSEGQLRRFLGALPRSPQPDLFTEAA
jgi:hypothetical protein